MNITAHPKKATLALLLSLATIAGTASASQTDIQVWATIDPELNLLKADGTAISSSVELTYNPATGLIPWTESVRVFANDVTSDVDVRLASAAVLNPKVAAAGAVDIPLTVSLNNAAVTTTARTMTAASLYPGSGMDGASISMPLSIGQETVGKIAHKGRYEGIVSIVLAQTPKGP